MISHSNQPNFFYTIVIIDGFIRDCTFTQKASFDCNSSARIFSVPALVIPESSVVGAKKEVIVAGVVVYVGLPVVGDSVVLSFKHRHSWQYSVLTFGPQQSPPS